MKLHLVLPLGLFLGLLVSPLRTQSLMPVHWETLDGQLDSAYIRYLWRPIKKVDAFPFYAEFLQARRELRNDVYLVNMKWLRNGNSVLIRRIVADDGQVRYLQLLYEGAVSLYKVIGEGTYYLEYQEELRLLDKAAPRNTLLELVLGRCLEQDFPRRVGGHEAALALVRQVNDCLNVPAYRWSPGQFSRRFKVGVGYDWMKKEAKDEIGFFRGFARAESYALQMPLGSLTVNYTPWPAAPWFSTDLQVRAIHFRREATFRFENFPGLRQESFAITNLYFYPGVRLQGSTRVIQPYLGVGPAIVLPFRFRYQMDFADPNFTHPGFPVSEELRAGQKVQVGLYATCGLNFRLFNRLLLGIGVRTEWLYQDWQHFEEVSPRNRHFLPYIPTLAPDDWRFLQLQLAYAWK